MNFYRKKLKSGLTVLFERRKLPLVCCSVALRYGSAYESEKLKGASHFLEHLVFKGTKKRTAKEISEEVERKGGILNAYTSEEVTCYWNKLPSKYVETGVDIVSDVTLNPLLKTEDLEKERKVILEEIRMRYDDPRIYVLERSKALLYEPPFNLPTAGTSSTVTSMSREDLNDIFRSGYGSSNMILTIVGNTDFELICELAEQLFPVQNTSVKEDTPILKNLEFTEKRKGIQQAHLVFSFHRPTLHATNRYAAELFDVILAGGMSSRLFQEIREKKGLAYVVRGFLEQANQYGYEMIYVGTMKNKVKQVKELIIKEIGKIKKLENVDLEEAKEQLLGLRNVETESSEQVMMNLLVEENAGDAREFYKYEERINGVNRKEVADLSQLTSYSFIALVPDE